MDILCIFLNMGKTDLEMSFTGKSSGRAQKTYRELFEDGRNGVDDMGCLVGLTSLLIRYGSQGRGKAMQCPGDQATNGTNSKSRHSGRD